MLSAFTSYDLETLSSLLPLEPSKRDRFPDPGTPSISQGEAVFFPIFCQNLFLSYFYFWS